MEEDTIYLELLTTGVVHLSKLLGCWQIKDKENSPLTINNYSLKHSGIIIIYTIYLKRDIVTFVMFERQTIEVFG